MIGRVDRGHCGGHRQEVCEEYDRNVEAGELPNKRQVPVLLLLFVSCVLPNRRWGLPVP